MKIACLGNMNNIMFQVGRYLEDEGHDVTFFLFEEFEHFLPQADSYDNVGKHKIIHLGWNHNSFFELSTKRIKKTVGGFDFYIGTDLSPAILYKIGVKLDIYFPHGNDLYDYAFPKYRNNPPQLWEIVPYIVGKAQFEGIKEARYISMDPAEDVLEVPLKKIRGSDKNRIASPPIMYLPQYTTDLSEKYRSKMNFEDLRKKYAFIVFQHGSQDWSDRGPFKINKGNNLLIEAFAKYLHDDNYSKDSALVLVEYGSDVQKSKDLIEKLNIGSNVIWLPKMQRKDIMMAISNSDIGVGELGQRHWFSYSCVFEFMTMKKPLIHHRNDAFYREKGLDLYPMVDADSVQRIYDTFIDYRKDPGKYIQMGNDAFDWLKKRNDVCVGEFNRIIGLKNGSNNKISNSLLKRLTFFFTPSIMRSYIFMNYHQLKNLVKGKPRLALD